MSNEQNYQHNKAPAPTYGELQLCHEALVEQWIDSALGNESSG